MPLVTPADSRPSHRRLWLLIGLLVTCRLILLVFAPHTDPSEARYAEISRKMVETGDWITPQDDYGVKFWAKPPLSMWVSALGMELFGANQFGSRIFIFTAALVVLVLVARMGWREFDKFTALAAVGMLMGMPLFFYCSAAVMTDLVLVLGTTLSMVSFREAIRGGAKPWGYGFFAGLAIGLLAKGPLALVLTGVPIGGWMLLAGKWKRTARALPWLGGTLLTLLLALPWYGLAEWKTPGFLEYFIVGEHWKRFTEKGWKGDMYGSGHASAVGMTWVFWLAGTAPWCLGWLAAPLSRWRELRAWALADDGRGLYLVLWALWPLVFFTPARNTIFTYPLPALPATALLLAEITRFRLGNGFSWRTFQPLHPALLVLCAGATAWAMAVSLIWPDAAPKKSERELVRRYQQDRNAEDHLLYFDSRKYSAEFYAEGNVEHTGSAEVVEQKLEGPGRLFLAVPDRYLLQLQSHLSVPMRDRFEPVGAWGGETLYVERQVPPPIAGTDKASRSRKEQNPIIR